MAQGLAFFNTGSISKRAVLINIVSLLLAYGDHLSYLVKSVQVCILKEMTKLFFEVKMIYYIEILNFLI